MGRSVSIKVIFYYISFLLLLIALVSIVSIVQMGGAIDVILKENLVSVNAGEEMVESLTSLNLIGLDSTRPAVQQTKNIGILHQNFMTAFLKAKNNITISDENEILNKIEIKFNQFFELVKSGEGVKQSDQKLDQLIMTYDDTQNLIKQLLIINNLAIQTTSSEAKNLSKSRSIWMIFLSVVGFISAFFLNRVIRNRFSIPVSEMLVNLRRSSFGDLDTRLKRREGELGELAEHINNLIDKVQATRSSSTYYALDQRDILIALVESLTAPTIVFNQEFQILTSNQAVRTVSGKIPNDEFIGTLRAITSGRHPASLHIGDVNYVVKFDVLKTPELYKLGFIVSLERSNT